jgi:hypothetical protein
MRVLVIVKATPTSESNSMPSDKMQTMLAEMGKYNEELVKAGIMQAAEGLQPSRMGKRILFQGGKKTVVDGPFAEAKELVAGFWIWKVKSMEEAVEWASRCPNPMPDEQGVLELRPIQELEDFGAEMTPELRAQEERIRRELEQRQRS